MKILIQLPMLESPVGLSGRVTRVAEFDNQANVVPGMGIQFTDLDPSKREQLETLVKRLQRDLGT